MDKGNDSPERGYIEGISNNPTNKSNEIEFSKSLEPAQRFAEKYELDGKLGQGGMSVVYRAKDRLINRLVAIKILLPGRELDDKSLLRFQQEARASASLDHPNIARIFEFNVTEKGVPYLIMELVEGRPLNDYINDFYYLSLEQTVPIVQQICSGMAYAHQRNILHRDIKPSNVLVVLQGEKIGSVKIVDFGIAKILDNSIAPTLTQTGEIFGSPSYMSPEQVRGEKMDARADIYSLGCLMFEMLVGKPPFVGSNAATTTLMHLTEKPLSLKESSGGRDFPDAIEIIVARALQKNADDRYASMSDFQRALSESTINSPNAITKNSNPDKSSSRPHAHRRAPAAIALGAVAAASLALFTLFMKAQTTNAGRAPMAVPEKPASPKPDPLPELFPPQKPGIGKATNAAPLSADRIFASQCIADRVGDEVSAERIPVTDEGLSELRKASTITSLNLAFTKISDAGLKQLQPLQMLRHLVLSGDSLNGDGFEYLNELPELKDLFICSMPALKTGAFGKLAKTNIAFLVANDDGLTDADLKDIALNKHLTFLEIRGNERITDAGLHHLSNLRLETLKVGKSDISDQGVRFIATKFPDIVRLDLHGTKISNKAIVYLETIRNMRDLDVSMTKIDSMSVASFKKMRSLQKLNLTVTRINQMDIDRLRRALPHCQIFHR